MIGGNKKKHSDALFTMDLEELKKGPGNIDRDIPIDWLCKEMNACEYNVEPTKAHVRLSMSASDQGVQLSGSASVRIKTECVKCMANTHLDLECALNSFMMPMGVGQEPEDHDGELTPQDLKREWYENGILVLDELIRDGIMLELPMNPQCSDSCPGIALQTFVNNKEDCIDPRLAPLASIKLPKE
jgi:uncharacterized protein